MDEEDTTNNYRIKDIVFFGSPRRILLQSANGPCPLLALCNVLLLRNQLKISQDARYISFNELTEMVTNFLFDANVSSTMSDGSSPQAARAANVRENLSSCLEVLPRLNVGLDVNCKFAGVSEFEYTKELAVFDLLDIGLFHGWVVSKQDQKAFEAFGQLSYNQIVEKIIAFEEAQQSIVDASSKNTAEGGAAAVGTTDEAKASASSSRPQSPTSDPQTQRTISDGIIIKEFMDRTASQLSYDGLLALHEAVKERELCVFFRNSHFSAMLKYNGDLYLLCTDIAFARSRFVWERLDEVDGDTAYCDSEFKESKEDDDGTAALQAAQTAAAAADPSSAAAMALQSDADAMLAWQMMQEDLQAQQMSDHQQAMQQAQQQRQQLPGTPLQGVPVQGTIVGGGNPVAPKATPKAALLSATPNAASSAPAAKKAAKEKKKGKSCCLQ